MSQRAIKQNDSKEDKNDLIRWKCRLCGYEWKGKSPKFRVTRPHCSRCGSWSVKVKDWIIDKERWERARLCAFERANGQCQTCGRKIDLSAQVHHLSYDDYYNVDNLICLCSHCHFLIHGKASSYIFGRISLILGIITIISGVLSINEMRISQAPVQNATSILAFIGLPIGIGLILLSLSLTKETRKVRRLVKKLIDKRPKHHEATSVENDITGSQIFYCHHCGKEISEQEFDELLGLCRQCRGMPSQKGFHAPPGFPKL